MEGIITGICVSECKGTVKVAVDSCDVCTEHGIEGDAHAGPGHRQLSFLAGESIDGVRDKLPDLEPGAFGENFITEGIDWEAIEIGQRLRIGDDVVVQVTQRGKECHTRCAIYYQTGDCIMPREGMFATVCCGGSIEEGDRIATEPELDRIRYAVVTVSDRSSAGAREDLSGPALGQIVDDALTALRVDYRVVPDEQDRIAETLCELCDLQVIDVIFTTGGTGLAPRDVTPEATEEVIDRIIPGMAEAMRAEGLRHTPHAMLSRAICGQRGSTLIINLSGSPKAVTEQLQVLLPTLPHAVAVVSGVPQDCARL